MLSYATPVVTPPLLTPKTMHSQCSRIHTISLKDVTHQYNKAYAQNIFKPVSMVLTQGQSYAVKGASGIGKTTLLHIIAQLIKPTQGTMSTYCTEQICTVRTALVFQQPVLIDELSVFENIIAGAVWHWPCKQQTTAYAHYLLNALCLKDLAQRRARSLSIGQQQRVCLARALISRPHFLIADEPSAALDQESSKNLYNLLTTIQRKYSVGIVIGSHDPLCLEHCDNLISLYPSEL